MFKFDFEFVALVSSMYLDLGISKTGSYPVPKCNASDYCNLNV